MVRLAIAVLFACAVGVGHASVRSEYELKAAFLFNFTRFVSWHEPPSDNPPLVVCVIGDNPFGDLLDPLIGKRSQGRDLELNYVRDPSGISACNVLFISASESRNLSALLALAQEYQVLTVSDIAGFVQAGGVIGYVQRGNVIRFEVNLAAAAANGLSVNSRLLELAARVTR